LPALHRRNREPAAWTRECDRNLAAPWQNVRAGNAAFFHRRINMTELKPIPDQTFGSIVGGHVNTARPFAAWP
jgi:hypothetical protein